MDTIDKNNTFCCAYCGNTHIQVRVWVDINTNEIVSDCEDGDAWCDDCETHVRYCSVAEFEKKHKNNNKKNQ